MRQTIYKVASIYSFFSFQENLILDLKKQLLSIESDNDLSRLLIIAKEGINGTICAEEHIIEKVLDLLIPINIFSKLRTFSIIFSSAQIVPLIPSFAIINKPERSLSFSILNNLSFSSRIKFS